MVFLGTTKIFPKLQNFSQASKIFSRLHKIFSQALEIFAGFWNFFQAPRNFFPSVRTFPRLHKIFSQALGILSGFGNFSWPLEFSLCCRKIFPGFRNFPRHLQNVLWSPKKFVPDFLNFSQAPPEISQRSGFFWIFWIF